MTLIFLDRDVNHQAKQKGHARKQTSGTGTVDADRRSDRKEKKRKEQAGQTSQVIQREKKTRGLDGGE